MVHITKDSKLLEYSWLAPEEQRLRELMKLDSSQQQEKTLTICSVLLDDSFKRIEKKCFCLAEGKWGEPTNRGECEES